MSPVRGLRKVLLTKTMRHRLRLELERLGLYVRGQDSRGLGLGADLKSALTVAPRTVFDVGAHKGESVDRFLRWFPQAEIYCFEPSAASYNSLRERLSGLQRVHCFHLGLSSAAGTGTLFLRSSSTNNSLTDYAAASGDEVLIGEQPVTITTLSRFCDQHAIDNIDFLKIDTEGSDLAVLHGADGLLAQQRIGVLQVEAGMNRGNAKHVPLERFRSLLEPHGYVLFGLYDQVREWPTDHPYLRRCNAVFIATRLCS